MSSNTSYGRLAGGIQGPSHTISSPIAPTFTDPVMKVAGLPRRHRAAFVGPAQSYAGRPLFRLGEMTDEIIANAKHGKQPKSEQPQPADVERARQQHQQATLDALTDQAESTATQPTARYALVIPHSGEVVTATRNSRNAPAYDGPVGSFGEPMGSVLGNTPSTFDTQVGYL